MLWVLLGDLKLVFVEEFVGKKVKQRFSWKKKIIENFFQFKSYENFQKIYSGVSEN